MTVGSVLARSIGAVEGPPAPQEAGYWRQSWRRLRRNRVAMVGLAIVAFVGLIGIAAPLIVTHDPNYQDLVSGHTFMDPNWGHLMGTDNLGRDWYSRLVYGARLSLTVGIFAQAIILAIGLPIGLVAGYAGGRVDNMLMRLTDLVYAFPDLLLIILMRNALGPGIFTLFLIIGLVSWVDMARLVRGQALSLRGREYVEASRSLGATGRHIVWRHILPNATGPIIVVVTFGIPRAVFVEATLSFIGLGVNPRTPSWGSMIFEGQSAIFSHPTMILFPALAVATLMLAFTFLGDGLRDALDPRTQRTTSSRTAEAAEASRRRTQPEAAPATEERERAA